jgi:hypothetical protein
VSRAEEFETMEFHPDELGHLKSRDWPGKIGDIRWDPKGENFARKERIKAKLVAGEDLGALTVKGADTGRRYLDDGHHRYVAAKELGIPVKVKGYYR